MRTAFQLHFVQHSKLFSLQFCVLHRLRLSCRLEGTSSFSLQLVQRGCRPPDASFLSILAIVQFVETSFHAGIKPVLAKDVSSVPLYMSLRRSSFRRNLPSSRSSSLSSYSLIRPDEGTCWIWSGGFYGATCSAE